MANHKIKVSLDLDAAGFTSKVKGAKRAIISLETSLSNTDETVKRNSRSMKKWGKGLRDVVVTVGLARHALMNLSDMFLSLPRNIIKNNAELERMRILMVGLGDGAEGWEASNKKAAESVSYIYDMAKRAPFEVGALTDSFVKLKAAGLDPADGSLESLVDSIAKFGGSSEQLKRASIAIQQMSGKGVISMEELRQQLGEAVPDAVMLMSRALGLTMGELVDKISQGTVEAKSALQAMFQQMATENGGSAILMSTTWEGTMQRLKTRWIETTKIIGEAGFFDAAKTALTDFTDGFMNSRDMAAAANDFGQALTFLIAKAREAIGIIKEYSTEIKFAAFALVGWKASSVVLASTMVTKLIPAIKKVGTAFMLNLTAIQASSTALGGFAAASRAAELTVSQGLTAAIAGIGTAIKGVFVAVIRFIPQLALITGAVWALSKAYDALFKSQQDLKNLDPATASSAQVEREQAKLERLQAQREKTIGLLERAKAKLAQTAQREGFGQTAWQRQIDRHEARIAQYDEEIALVEKFTKAAERLDNLRAAEAANRESLIASAQDLAKVRKQATLGLREAIDEINAGPGTDQEKQGLRIEAGNKFRNFVIDAALKDIAVQRKVIAEKLEATLDDDYAAIEQLVARDEELESKMANLEAEREKRGGLVEIGKDKKNLTGIERWTASAITAYEKLGAKIDDTGEKQAELNSRLANEYKDASPEQRLAATSAAAQLDERKKLWDNLTKAANTYRASIKRIVKLEGIISKMEDANATSNPWTKRQAQTKQYTVELQRMIDEQRKLLKLFESDEDAAPILAHIENLEALVERSKGAGVGAVTGAMDTKTIEFNESLLTQTEKIEAKYARLREQAQSWRQDQLNMTDDQVASFDKYLEALAKVEERAKETPVQKMFREWEDSTIRFQQATATAIDGFSTTLATALVKGEADFKSFAESIIQMFIEIALQKQIAGLVSNFVPNLFGGSTSPVQPSVPSGGSGPFGFGTYANGGIMSSKGDVPLRKYARGGIANRPQVALFGEGDQNEAFVPLPDGRRIPVKLDVKGAGGSAQPPVVNVINQGQPAQVESSNQRFDGKRWVLDIVMSEASKPGSFRDTLKGGR